MSREKEKRYEEYERGTEEQAEGTFHHCWEAPLVVLGAGCSVTGIKGNEVEVVICPLNPRASSSPTCWRSVDHGKGTF